MPDKPLLPYGWIIEDGFGGRVFASDYPVWAGQRSKYKIIPVFDRDQVDRMAAALAEATRERAKDLEAAVQMQRQRDDAEARVAALEATLREIRDGEFTPAAVIAHRALLTGDTRGGTT